MSDEQPQEGVVDPPESTPVDAIKELYNKALATYRSKHGKEIAKAHRVKGEDDENAEPNPPEEHDPSLTYAETTLEPMQAIMCDVQQTVTIAPGGTCFVDIGSGAGIAVLAAAACQQFKKAVGVECVPGLVAKSNELKDGSDFLDIRLCSVAEAEQGERSADDEAVTADNPASDDVQEDPALPAKPSTPLVLFWLSTCFNENSVQEKALQIAKITPEHTVLVLVTHFLRTENANVWSLEAETKVQFEWGLGTVFIYRNIMVKSSPAAESPE
ncbi:hypothetical protein FOL47_008526 [Perkinsus chesapeaki]|uniref:DOT1 domain-containing protein n=1 Tax=Perkinsus chesapeaki TaxID=330153 RepID=A0A7J6LE97_PERCH|nr:hypothetical protein FOL47_008526 [Perkinsus chesapeaki]